MVSRLPVRVLEGIVISAKHLTNNLIGRRGFLILAGIAPLTWLFARRNAHGQPSPPPVVSPPSSVAPPSTVTTPGQPTSSGTTLANFPDQTADSSGLRLTRDRGRLLLAFIPSLSLADIERRLSDSHTGIMLESRKGRVNHTEHRFWVEALGNDITQQQVSNLENFLGTDLDWIGPVYSRPNPLQGTNDILLCPLPMVLLVQPKPGASPSAIGNILNQYQLQEVPKISNLLVSKRYFVLKKGSGKAVYLTVRDILNDANALNLIKELRFDYMPFLNPSASCCTTGSAMPPNDQHYQSGAQWNMNRIRAGNLTNGTTCLPHSTGLTGWEICRGDSSVVIGMIDREGFFLTHPDLQQNYLNSGQTYNFPNDPEAGAGQTSSAYPHGTQCAGVAAAIHNVSGVAGIAGQCKILPIRPQNGTATEVAASVRWAADHGAHVISMSFGWFLQSTDQTLTDLNAAIDYAFQTKHKVLCAATMNNGNEIWVFGSPQVIPNGIHYPANYYPAVIACGASNCLDKRCDIYSGIRDFPYPWKGSNYGDQLSVVAPGTSIPTTTILYYDLDFWGTSAATPHIAGLAALLLSHYPLLISNPAKVREIIERTADKVPYPSMYNIAKASGSWNNEMGYGRINVYRALNEGSNYIGSYCGAPPSAPVNLQVQ